MEKLINPLGVLFLTMLMEDTPLSLKHVNVSLKYLHIKPQNTGRRKDLSDTCP